MRPRLDLQPPFLLYETGFFKMSAKLVFAESFCVSGGAPYLATPSRIHQVHLFLDAKLNALVVNQVAPRLNVKPLPRLYTIRSFLVPMSPTKMPLLSRRASPHLGDLLLKSPSIRYRLLACLRLPQGGGSGSQRSRKNRWERSRSYTHVPPPPPPKQTPHQSPGNPRYSN